MWNQKLADRPPLNSYRAPNKTLDLIRLRNVLHYGLEHFNNDELWNTEIALLCRVIYRMKMKFRSSKDFKLLEKLRRQLEKCHEINVGKQLKIILSMVPRRYEPVTYLPTKNMLDYILVKLQGLAKVFVKSFETCLQVCAEINQRLYVGHFWMLFFIIFSLVSRLSILIKFKTKFVCDLYAKLLPYSHQLRNDGPNWLPKDYVLPKDLKVWLEVLWVYEEECVDLTFEPVTVDFMNLIEDKDEDVLFCEEYILLDDEDKRIAKDFKRLTPMKEVLNKNRMRGFSIGENDIGEEITEVIELNDPNAEENLMPNMISSEDEVELNSLQESVIFVGETSCIKSNIKKRKGNLLGVPMDSVIIEEDEDQNQSVDVGEELGNCESVQKKKTKKTAKKKKKVDVALRVLTPSNNRKKKERKIDPKRVETHQEGAGEVSLKAKIDKEISELLAPMGQFGEIRGSVKQAAKRKPRKRGESHRKGAKKSPKKGKSPRKKLKSPLKKMKSPKKRKSGAFV